MRLVLKHRGISFAQTLKTSTHTYNRFNSQIYQGTKIKRGSFEERMILYRACYVYALYAVSSLFYSVYLVHGLSAAEALNRQSEPEELHELQRLVGNELRADSDGHVRILDGHFTSEEIPDKRISEFLGKRSPDKRVSEFLGKRFNDKRISEFLGKRNNDFYTDGDMDKRLSEFLGKRAEKRISEFLGKRDPEKRISEFLGKRDSEKRISEFLGR